MRKLQAFGAAMLCLGVGGGCTHIAAPGSVPEITLLDVRAFNKGALALKADPSAEGLQLFLEQGVHLWYVDLAVWNRFFVVDLTKELTRRGVTVAHGRGKEVEILLDGFSVVHRHFYFWGDWSALVRMRVTVGDGNVWIDERFRGRSARSMGRALEGALYYAKRRLLTHQGFRRLLQ